MQAVLARYDRRMGITVKLKTSHSPDHCPSNDTALYGEARTIPDGHEYQLNDAPARRPTVGHGRINREAANHDRLVSGTLDTTIRENLFRFALSI